MKTRYEIIEGIELIDSNDYVMNFKCEIVNVELKFDNAPEGEDELVFYLRVLPRESPVDSNQRNTEG